ncbi:hypothetical protein BJX99DRAFT_233995, partial [Aspergillus californicus]
MYLVVVFSSYILQQQLHVTLSNLHPMPKLSKIILPTARSPRPIEFLNNIRYHPALLHHFPTVIQKHMQDPGAIQLLLVFHKHMAHHTRNMVRPVLLSNLFRRSRNPVPASSRSSSIFCLILASACSRRLIGLEPRDWFVTRSGYISRTLSRSFPLKSPSSSRTNESSPI